MAKVTIIKAPMLINIRGLVVSEATKAKYPTEVVALKVGENEFPDELLAMDYVQMAVDDGNLVVTVSKKSEAKEKAETEAKEKAPDLAAESKKLADSLKKGK
jgi:hypothetical protein